MSWFALSLILLLQTHLALQLTLVLQEVPRDRSSQTVTRTVWSENAFSQHGSVFLQVSDSAFSITLSALLFQELGKYLFCFDFCHHGVFFDC